MNDSRIDLPDASTVAVLRHDNEPVPVRPSLFRRLRHLILTLAVIGLAAAGVVVMKNREASAPHGQSLKKDASANAVMVTTDLATYRAVQRRVGVVGSLWGRDEIAVTPKVEGTVLRIRHDVGDIVHPGEVLLEIDETDYRLAAQESMRALDLELSRLDLRLPAPIAAPKEGTPLEREMARLGLRDMPPANFDSTRLPAVQKAAAQERNAISKRDRLKKITASATVEEKDQAETEVLVAQASYRQTLLEAESTLATVRLKKASLETALQRLIDTKVTAPTSPAAGKKSSPASAEQAVVYLVAKRSISAGEKFQALTTAAPVFRLVVADPLKLVVTVPERHLKEVKANQIVELFVESHPQEPFKGRVSRVNPTVDRDNRTFEVEVLIPNANNQLNAGSFVTGAILTRIDDQALTVPEEAIAQSAGVTSLFVLRNGKATEVPVEMGVRIEVAGPKRPRWWIEVRGKLQAGDEVITSGQTQLADGVPAKVRPTSVE